MFRPMQQIASVVSRRSKLWTPTSVISTRCFATNPLEATAKAYDDLVQKSIKEYEANKKTVSDDLDAELASNKMVLFMEGTPDAPMSEASMNMVKMMTQVQAVPFVAIDVLKHPALMGYSVTKSSKNRCPHLYVNG